MCTILKNHIETQSFVIWEYQVQKIYYYTYQSWLVGWLILLPPRVGWDIMGYESETLSS